MAAEPPIHTGRIRKADSTPLIQVLLVPPVTACLNVCFAPDRVNLNLLYRIFVGLSNYFFDAR